MSADLRALAIAALRAMWRQPTLEPHAHHIDAIERALDDHARESRRELLEAVRLDRIVATDYRTHADWCPYAHHASNCGCGLFDRVTASRALLDAALLELDDAKGKP